MIYVIDYNIIDHGLCSEEPDIVPSDFRRSALGRGRNPREALADALRAIQESYWEIEVGDLAEKVRQYPETPVAREGEDYYVTLQYDIGPDPLP